MADKESGNRFVSYMAGNGFAVTRVFSGTFERKVPVEAAVAVEKKADSTITTHAEAVIEPACA